MQEREMGRRRIVLFPFPFQGHVNPMLHLATILHSKGISITFLITNSNHVHPSTYPHFSFVSLSPSLPHNYSSSPSIAGALSMVPLLNENYAQPFKHCLTGLLSHASMAEEKVSCLVTDPFWFLTHPVALDLNLPRLTLRTGSLSSSLAYSYFPLLLQQGILPVHESEMEREIPQLAPLRGRDLPTVGVHDQRSYFYECVQKMVENIKTSSGMICNSFEELEQEALSKSRQEFKIPHFPIGPFHLQLQPTTTTPPPQGWTSVVAWLDQQPPASVLYVSFGTLVDIDAASFGEMAWGLCESQVSFLWVIRPGFIKGWEGEEPPFPEGFEERVGGRGRSVKWAVQVEVLSHEAVGGFWSHNGWNSTMESVSAGVPMVCMPGGVDQMVNARHVCHCWKVGVQIEKGFDREEIKKAIVEVMVSEEGGDMRRAQLLKEKARLSVIHGGSSAKCVDQLMAYIHSL